MTHALATSPPQPQAPSIQTLPANTSSRTTQPTPPGTRLLPSYGLLTSWTLRPRQLQHQQTVSFIRTDHSPGATTQAIDGLARGSIFPAGTTTGTHAVTDASPNTASCTFTVTVITPQAVIQNLITNVSNSSLTGTQKNGLLAKLNAALDGLNSGQTNVACNKLDAFISSVQNLVGHGDITSAQGASWTISAKHVRNSIGCTNLGCS